jgi:transcriptional regulator with XRE-family HTH domain
MSYQTINLGNIKVFANRKKISLVELADKIGMTYVGLSKVIRENTTTLTTIIKIADVLGVPVQLFFVPESELVGYDGFSIEKYNLLKAENEELKREISELKNKIIRLADRL